MVMEINLTKGKKAIVDDIDKDLAGYNWSVSQARGWYAVRKVRDSERGMVKANKFKMHRVILERIVGRPLLESEFTDHKNGNGLDNRRDNLRIAALRQNNANRGKYKACMNGSIPSKFKGTSWHTWKGHNKWMAYIRVERKLIHLGYFNDEIEAAKAYDRAALKYFKEFANINFPREEY